MLLVLTIIDVVVLTMMSSFESDNCNFCINDFLSNIFESFITVFRCIMHFFSLEASASGPRVSRTKHAFS